METTTHHPTQVDVFWGEIAPCEHLVEFYGNEARFLDNLTSFVVGGFLNGESVIVIATPEHLLELDKRLVAAGHDLVEYMQNHQYVQMDARATLALFMIGDWPDEQRFKNTVQSLLKLARGNQRRVRAFGEMVVMLWAQGRSGATVQLEHLWHKLCQEIGLTVFCAYPKTGFTDDPTNSLQQIIDSHSQVVA